MEGKVCHNGYRGYVPDYPYNNGYMLFSTEEDYEEYYRENILDKQTD